MSTQRVVGPGVVGESLRTLFSVGTLSGLTDGQLLERFAAVRGGTPESEAAFTASGGAPWADGAVRLPDGPGRPA